MASEVTHTRAVVAIRSVFIGSALSVGCCKRGHDSRRISRNVAFMAATPCWNDHWRYGGVAAAPRLGRTIPFRRPGALPDTCEGNSSRYGLPAPRVTDARCGARRRPELRQCSVSPIRVVKPDNRVWSRGITRGRCALHNPVFLSFLQRYRRNRHLHASASRLCCGCGDKFRFRFAEVRRIYCDLESRVGRSRGWAVCNDNLVDRFARADDRSCRSFPIVEEEVVIIVTVDLKAVITK